jgi:Helix-turn-helix domain
LRRARYILTPLAADLPGMSAFLEIDEPGATLAVPGAQAHPGATLAEAAAIAGVSVHTLRRLVRSGRLAAELVNGDRGPEYRISLSALASLAPGHPGAHAGADRVTLAPAQAGATVAATVAHRGARVRELEEEVAWLRERLSAADQREADLRAQLATAISATDRLAEAVAAAQARRFPWQPTSPDHASANTHGPRRRWRLTWWPRRAVAAS